MIKKLSLKDRIEKIDWMALEAGKNYNRVSDNQIGVSYIRTDKKHEHAGKIKLRIGAAIRDALNWDLGDYISAMYDPDDVFSLILVKASNPEKGRKLYSETGTKIGVLSFTWLNNIKLDPMPSKIVETEIYKQYVNVQLPKQTDK